MSADSATRAMACACDGVSASVGELKNATPGPPMRCAGRWRFRRRHGRPPRMVAGGAADVQASTTSHSAAGSLQDVVETSIADLQAAMQARRISAVELVQEYVDR